MDRLTPVRRLQGLLLAFATLLAGLPSPVRAADAPLLFKYAPQTLSEADRRATAMLYARTCAVCHGRDGGGVNNGLALYNAKVPLISAGVIHFGAVEPVDKPIIMPAYGALSLLSPTEIGQLAEYIKSFRPPWP